MFIYLDNSSTTRVKPEVAEKMVNVLTKDFGNPSSLHRLGLSAEKLIKEARANIAGALNASPEEIFFTSCGSESNNTVIRGVWESRRKQGRRIITSAVEHPAVLRPCEYCVSSGAELVYIPVDGSCRLDMKRLRDDLNEDTVLVSIMQVNNEVGSIMPLSEIAAEIKKRAPKALFHSDAVQGFGKIPCDVRELGVDLMSISAHKIHGPKGIGALYIRKGVHLSPFILGGGQESGFRSGTEAVADIVGFGEAVKALQPVDPRVRDYLIKRLREYFGDTVKINSPLDGADSILNVSFAGCRAEVLLHMLEEKDIYVSTGSACSSNSKKKGSHVLRAMGLGDDDIEGALRFSFCYDNTPEQMDRLINILFDIVGRHRALMNRAPAARKTR